MSLLINTAEGLYCPAAKAWIDPHRPVQRALITHAHADHARPGCDEYWATSASEGILRQRLGQTINLRTLNYGDQQSIGDALVSFHSAGHVLGSAQIRLEVKGEVWVVTGDYKRCPDPSCAPFESVPCDVLITEATFALPIYRWSDGATLARNIQDWWQGDRSRPSLLFCYAFGKAQRILAELAAIGVEEEVLLHGAVETVTRHYRDAAIPMVPSRPVVTFPGRNHSQDGWCLRHHPPIARVGCVAFPHLKQPLPPAGWPCAVPDGARATNGDSCSAIMPTGKG